MAEPPPPPYSGENLWAQLESIVSPETPLYTDSHEAARPVPAVPLDFGAEGRQPWVTDSEAGQLAQGQSVGSAKNEVLEAVAAFNCVEFDAGDFLVSQEPEKTDGAAAIPKPQVHEVFSPEVSGSELQDTVSGVPTGVSTSNYHIDYLHENPEVMPPFGGFSNAISFEDRVRQLYQKGDFSMHHHSGSQSNQSGIADSAPWLKPQFADDETATADSCSASPNYSDALQLFAVNAQTRGFASPIQQHPGAVPIIDSPTLEASRNHSSRMQQVYNQSLDFNNFERIKNQSLGDRTETRWRMYKHNDGDQMRYYYHHLDLGISEWTLPRELQVLFEAINQAQLGDPPCHSEIALPPALPLPTPPAGRSAVPAVGSDSRHFHQQKQRLLMNQVYVPPPSPQSSLPSPATASTYGPPGSNLFIFHIPSEWCDSDLVQHFERFGTILSARIRRDAATGRNIGYGFVSFNNQQSARQAISEMNGFYVAGKWLKVNLKKGEEHVLSASSPSPSPAAVISSPIASRNNGSAADSSLYPTQTGRNQLSANPNFLECGVAPAAQQHASPCLLQARTGSGGAQRQQQHHHQQRPPSEYYSGPLTPNNETFHAPYPLDFGYCESAGIPNYPALNAALEVNSRLAADYIFAGSPRSSAGLFESPASPHTN